MVAKIKGMWTRMCVLVEGGSLSSCRPPQVLLLMSSIKLQNVAQVLYDTVQPRWTLGYLLSALGLELPLVHRMSRASSQTTTSRHCQNVSIQVHSTWAKGNSSSQQRISEQNLIATDSKTVPHYKPRPTIKSLTRTKVDSD